MTTRIAGIILRATEKDLTARFYAELGLKTHEHEHGGPKHYEVTPLSPEYAVEIYKKSPTFSSDAIMLEVDSLATALYVAAKFGIEPKGGIRDTDTTRFIYITDPDGRSVMLIEKK